MKKFCFILSATWLVQLIFLQGCAVNHMQNMHSSVPTAETVATQEGTSAQVPSESTLASEPIPSHSEPSTSPTHPSETQPAASAPTKPPQPITQPSDVFLPETEPQHTDPAIIPLYTREQLEALDNTLVQYGCGRSTDGIRPNGALWAQSSAGQYGAHFIEDDSPVIYLTFDCGYEYENLTAGILDTLMQKDVKAVFFVTMSYVKANPQLVWRMIQEGHVLGSHSANHHSMPSLTIEEMEVEITELHNYVKDCFGYEMYLFRPPKGEYSIRSLAVTQNLGYTTVQWSFAYADWDTANQPEHSAALERITGSAHNGAIYLLHAVSAANAAVLSNAIDAFRAQGYSLELFGA